MAKRSSAGRDIRSCALEAVQDRLQNGVTGCTPRKRVAGPALSASRTRAPQQQFLDFPPFTKEFFQTKENAKAKDVQGGISGYIEELIKKARSLDKVDILFPLSCFCSSSSTKVTILLNDVRQCWNMRFERIKGTQRIDEKAQLESETLMATKIKECETQCPEINIKGFLKKGGTKTFTSLRCLTVSGGQVKKERLSAHHTFSFVAVKPPRRRFDSFHPEPSVHLHLIKFRIHFSRDSLSMSACCSSISRLSTAIWSLKVEIWQHKLPLPRMFWYVGRSSQN